MSSDKEQWDSLLWVSCTLVDGADGQLSGAVGCAQAAEGKGGVAELHNALLHLMLASIAESPSLIPTGESPVRLLVRVAHPFPHSPWSKSWQHGQKDNPKRFKGETMTARGCSRTKEETNGLRHRMVLAAAAVATNVWLCLFVWACSGPTWQ